MAYLRLAYAVDSSETLLQPIGIPREVIIHHQVRTALKVHAFASGIICDHYSNHWIGIESCDGRAPRFAGNTSVNDYDGCRIAHASSYFLLQILKRISRLSKD